MGDLYICYLDESGTPDPDANSSHFVLLGLAIPAATWKAKDLEVAAIKGQYGLQSEEVHTAWMARDYPEQARIPNFDQLSWEERRNAVLGVRALNLARPRKVKQQRSLLKNYRKTEPYVHLTRQERLDCLDELARLVGSWRDARIFAEAQDKVHAPGVPSFDIAFEQIVTRFNTYLKKVGPLQGLMVQDNNETVARRFTKMMRRFYSDGTIWAEIDCIIETPLFVDSNLTSMVQLADLCAYATRRFFERGEQALLSKFYRRFDRHQKRLVGLRHFTGTYQCQCKVCIAHGRYRT